MPERPHPTAAQELARFICGLRAEDIPPDAMEAAGRCVLDLLGVSLTGHDTPAATAARAFGAEFFPAGPASVWFSPLRLNPAAAAMLNAAAACVHDLDDGHRAAGGHPGASIIPAALAQAQALAKQGEDFLAAVVIGYEVAVRLAAARDLSALDTFSTGRWCGMGAAAAAGWLAGVEDATLAQALSIAGIHAPLQSASAYSRLGHNVKEGIAWGTFTGLAALGLAERGYTGPLDIFDHPGHFDRVKILKDLGQDWAIKATYFKPYACCRWIHAALDALRGLMAEHGIGAQEIKSVEVHTFKRALGLKNQTDPRSLEGAQFSIPYCLALAAWEGEKALQPLTDARLGRPDLVAWAGRVSLHLAPDLEARFPALAAARVVLKTAGGDFSRQVDHPRGDAANPFSQAELEAKFKELAQNRVPSAQAEEILNSLEKLKRGELKPLLAALRQPAV